MHYMIVESLEMSDEPEKEYRRYRIGVSVCKEIDSLF